jgi:23S rRNA (cytosine1962-C5)-methyltransferase
MAAETSIRKGHPWLFADSIRDQNRPGKTNETAVIYDRQNKFLALGLFDADSPIRVRLLIAGKPQELNSAWWRRRLSDALQRREGLFDDQTTGYRCINGESDGWPALVLDRYGSNLVLKLYSAIWLPRIQEITSLLVEQLEPERVVLRLSRNIQQVAGSEFSLVEGQVLSGPALKDPVIFKENGLFLEADIIRGQKTGFFLDQRENRSEVGRLASGANVLNAFSFSGGFSLYVARAGAQSVTDLDISRHALESSQRNFALNNSTPNIAASRHELIQADAFEWLEQNLNRRFNLVILDPPSLAKRQTEQEGALRAYRRLVKAALGHLEAGGTLVACSCSAHVSSSDFFQAVKETAAASRRVFRVIRTSAHAEDHPATFPEAHYLKAIYLGL